MYTYIVVDDEEITRKGTIKKLSSLQEEAACIGEAGNGQEALELLERVHPDIVILDMQMPVMDGTQLLPVLSERYPQMPLIVISGYRDFDYVRHALGANAIDYVLKPFSSREIVACMRAAMTRLEDESERQSRILVSEEEKEAALYDYDLQILQGMVMGYETKKDRVSSKRLLFINQASYFAVFVLLPWGRGQGRQQGPGDSEKTASWEEELLEEWLRCHSLTGMAVPLKGPGEGSRLLPLPFFFGQGGGSRERLGELGEDLLDFLSEQGCPAVLGISGLHMALSDLHTAYEEARAALDGRGLFRRSEVLFPREGREPLPVNWEKWEELLFRIEAGSTGEAEALMGEFYAYLQSIPGMTLFDEKYQGYLLSGECRRILSYYLGQLEAEKKSVANVTSSIYDPEELWAYYRQMAKNLASLLKEQSVYAQEDVIEGIKAYMERNYQKDLSQERVSYLFYISRSYLSSLFKARTGEKFVDYLNGIRIEKAKELLAATDRKMYFIAKAVGYDNVKYFFRIFKKRTGITPEKYREEARKNSP